MWLKLTRAYTGVIGGVDSKSANVGHVSHCVSWLGEEMGRLMDAKGGEREAWTSIPVSYLGCVDIRGI
jgi:hypothetical protein